MDLTGIKKLCMPKRLMTDLHTVINCMVNLKARQGERMIRVYIKGPKVNYDWDILPLSIIATILSIMKIIIGQHHRHFIGDKADK
jgi:hypothetical protein